MGNLQKKDDFASSYHYTGAKPNAVSSVDLVAGGNISYGYDANGNRTHENGAETLRYNAFNKPTRIVRNGATVEFFYGANQMRNKRVAGGKTTLYIDKLFEKISVTGEDQYRLFIEDIAVLTHTVKANGTSSHKIGFTHRDRLGSSVAISDHLGVLQESQSYDPFGKPRAGDLADLLNAIVDSPWTTRGFTDPSTWMM